MRRLSRLLLSVGLAATVACGSTGPSEPVYEIIADTYVGTLSGVTEGVALAADFALTISQSGGSLSGTWALDGILTDGVDVIGVAGTGTITGTIASGNNPSVNLTIREGICPNYQAQFSGAYDSANQRLTITGPIDVLDPDDCSILLRYQGSILLQR